MLLCLHLDVWMCVSVCTYVCVCACVRVRACVCMCVCMCVYVCVLAYWCACTRPCAPHVHHLMCNGARAHGPAHLMRITSYVMVRVHMALRTSCVSQRQRDL